ncbi:nitroreductase family deazaflavin-dependent oxidoreductase [Microbacterium sp. CFH 31415]|uniref:nitroreductase family deazaflavin-dependent oxidoreductase n=1 Tax=Microbacterium sp. CFH 31415 TaxID=2921732 RepID=UPI001F12D7C4|nr:nitroreductase family deazaflavin-dependent oxidoreductase [Microbacterium sp. CFH 31415]MCH6231856.1 nitroreductase family deazaflavin-dependent oxidoreductase [Microbacterium sp. CFH 31415]
MTSEPRVVDRLMARLLRVRWLMRLPIPLYRASLGWIFGDRLVMIEHRGRTSGERRFVVVEVIGMERNAVRVASGFGRKSQWYRNLAANGVAFLSVGRYRRVRAQPRLLDPAASATVLAAYAAAHPEAWSHLRAAMEALQGGEPDIPVVEFGPPSGGTGIEAD